ncbi:MAG: methyltransferase family protein [Promethearchaeota archaeon]|jgi:protein-S-isoprenylcysteine O-methyltransferase Ste14
MSTIPAFELGVWNAWIFVVPMLLLMIIGNVLIKKREMASLSEYLSDFSKKEKILVAVLMIPILSSYFYSIFLPLKIGTIWFYIGLVIYLLGIGIQIITWQHLATGSVERPVTKGIYRFSRNPMYIGDILIFTSIAIACISWIFLIIVVLSIAANYLAVISEERECLAKYGDEYREYMSRTPRWIGKPQS